MFNAENVLVLAKAGFTAQQIAGLSMLAGQNAQPAQPAAAQPQINPVMPNPIFTQSFGAGLDTPVSGQSAAPVEEEDDGDYFNDLLSILNKRS